MVDISEICSAIKRGEDGTEAIAKIEPRLKRFCERREAVHPFVSGSDLLCEEDALYEISLSVKAFWNVVLHFVLNRWINRRIVVILLPTQRVRTFTDLNTFICLIMFLKAGD